MITAEQITDHLEYSFAWTEESIQVAGYTIEIERDSQCDSPYDSGDGNSPALWLGLGRSGDLREFGGENLESFFEFVPDHWISRHWRKICAALDIDAGTHDREAREIAKAESWTLATARRDCFADHLQNMRAESWGAGIDYLQTLRALYRLAGIPAETYQHNGYCQGDSVYGLIVMTPAWAKHVGAPHATMATIDKAESDMKAQADEYGAWCWGDCYGYSITGPDGQNVDSCWGFIGSDPKDSGMLDAILESINWDMEHRRKERLGKVKAYIKARVPLITRAVLLDAFPC